MRRRFAMRLSTGFAACAFSTLAAIVVALTSAGSAQAQPIMHRTAVAAGEAAPTNGSFSIRFPIAFNDIELRAEDPTAPTIVVRILSGVDSSGLRFSATETPLRENPSDIEEFMEAAGNRPGALVSDVAREQADAVTVLSFALTDPKGGNYFRVIRTRDTQYMLVVQFPEASRSQAASMTTDFFASFKTTRP